MKVLIDECAPKALKVALAARGFGCTTVQEAGFVFLLALAGLCRPQFLRAYSLDLCIRALGSRRWFGLI
jgi:hypothetical protein